MPQCINPVHNRDGHRPTVVVVTVLHLGQSRLSIAAKFESRAFRAARRAVQRVPGNNSTSTILVGDKEGRREGGGRGRDTEVSTMATLCSLGAGGLLTSLVTYAAWRVASMRAFGSLP